MYLKQEENKSYHNDRMLSIHKEIQNGLLRYLESRSVSDKNVNTLIERHLRNDVLYVMRAQNTEIQNEICLRGKKVGLPVYACVLADRKHKELPLILFSASEKANLEQIREQYLLEHRYKCQTSLEFLEKLSVKRELVSAEGLDFTQMKALKERAKYHGILFAASGKNDDMYTFYIRAEDKKSFDVMFAGLKREQEGIGKEIYEIEKKNHERMIQQMNLSVASKEQTTLIMNQTGSVCLYLDPKELYYEDMREKRGRKIISRDDKEFERTFFDLLQRITHPIMLQGENAEHIYHEREQLKSKDIGALIKQSIDLLHTREEGLSFVHPNIWEIYNAEHEILLNYEYGIIHGGSEMRSMADMYISGEISMAEIKQFEPAFTAKYKKSIDWKHPIELSLQFDKNDVSTMEEYLHEFDKDRYGENRIR